MRRQYHFRTGPDGLCAWDVHRLVALAAGLPTEALPLAAVRELDEAYWYGDEGDVPTCRSIADHMRLVQETDLAHPIIVCPEGRVMDGMHRVVKALLEGRSAVAARRLPELPAPDFVGVDPNALEYDDDPAGIR